MEHRVSSSASETSAETKRPRSQCRGMRLVLYCPWRGVLPAAWLQRVQWGARGTWGAVRARDGADLLRLTRPTWPRSKPAQPPRSAAWALSARGSRGSPCGAFGTGARSLQVSGQWGFLEGTRLCLASRETMRPKAAGQHGATAHTASTPTAINALSPRARPGCAGHCGGSLEAWFMETSPQQPAQHPYPGRPLAPGLSGCLPASAARAPHPRRRAAWRWPGRCPASQCRECGGRRGRQRGRDGSSVRPGFCLGTWCGRLSSAEQSPLPGPHLVAGLGADCWLAAPSRSSRISSVLAVEVTMVPEPCLAPAASASSPAPVSSGEKLSRAS